MPEPACPNEGEQVIVHKYFPREVWDFKHQSLLEERQNLNLPSQGEQAILCKFFSRKYIRFYVSKTRHGKAKVKTYQCLFICNKTSRLSFIKIKGKKTFITLKKNTMFYKRSVNKKRQLVIFVKIGGLQKGLLLMSHHQLEEEWGSH